MHENFACQHNFPTTYRRLNVSLADGTVHRSQLTTNLVMKISNVHFEVLRFQLITLGNYPLILGMDWLRKHNPAIDWEEGTVRPTCQSRHLLSTLPSQALADIPKKLPDLFLVDRPKTFSPQARSPPRDSQLPVPSPPPNTHSKINVSLVKSDAFMQMIQDDYAQAYMLDVSLIASLASIGSDTQPVQDLPAKYKEFADVFSKQEADKLPPHRLYDHTIPIREGETVPYGPVYNLSQSEIEALHNYIKENLDKGFIRRSESPAGALILFVKKRDGTLRLCVDDRGLNKVTVPNRCPLPLISETFDRLSKAKRFTKLDMRGAYNLLRIADGDEWKTAFRCRYGHFEYRIMPFGLMNAPASFQAFMNDVLPRRLPCHLPGRLPHLHRRR